MLAVQNTLRASTANAAITLFILCGFFHFAQYAARSAPGVMIPELSQNLDLATAAMGALIGSYYYTYSLTSVVAGGLLDKFGARAPVAVGMLMFAAGCTMFASAGYSVALAGRLLQGCGAAFAFTGAVYIATQNFAPARLASAIGIVQAFGMFGGSAGQFAVAQLIHRFAVSWQLIWYGLAVGVLVLAVLVFTRRESEQPVASLRTASGTAKTSGSALAGYRTVFSNHQSWICGICAGLLFIPTTVGDMIWRVAFFTKGLQIDYQDAVTSAALVLFGWVIGCPLLGWVSDRIHRRKPVVIAGGVALLAAEAMVLYGPPRFADSLALSLFFGIVSGAAMIPYTMIKEANPAHVAGTATGIMNLLVFATSAVVAPLASAVFAHAIPVEGLPAQAFQGIALLLMGCIVGAIILACFLEDRHASRPAD